MQFFAENWLTFTFIFCGAFLALILNFLVILADKGRGWNAVLHLIFGVCTMISFWLLVISLVVNLIIFAKS